LGIDSQWIDMAREILIMSNSAQLDFLNPSNSRGLNRGSNSTPSETEKGGIDD